MEMEDQYGIADLRQLISRAVVGAGHPFPPYPPQAPSDLYHHRGITSPAASQYEMLVMGRHVTPPPETADMFNQQQAAARAGPAGFHHHHHHQHHNQEQLNCDSTTSTATASGFDGGEGASARWPRQETLTLLEVRSRLHHKFKEANQKGPLWDEVARIMSEEHGYQRSGKKCREKFENLYKYYKKTKEGKAGRQDGKHYRFFRQLEALYGSSTSDDTHIPQNTPHFNNNPTSAQAMNPHLYPPHPPPRGLCDTSVSLSNGSSDLDPSSSDDEDDRDLNCQDGEEPSMESNGLRERNVKKRRGKRSNWKGKIKEFIDLQMTKVMEKQEAWLEKMMKTLEGREQERLLREEEWRRRQEAARVEREHKFWESERAWNEARDSALMKTLEKLTHAGGSGSGSGGGLANMDQWPEPEITRLIQLRTNMESRLQQCGISEEVLWEDIATKMAYFGYEKSAIVCKEKWDSINKEFLEKGSSRKRKEDYTNYGVSNLNEGGLYMNQLSGFNNCGI